MVGVVQQDHVAGFHPVGRTRAIVEEVARYSQSRPHFDQSIGASRSCRITRSPVSEKTPWGGR